MFDSLADQIRHDEEGQTSNKQRMVRYGIIAVVSILVFLGLIVAVRMGA